METTKTNEVFIESAKVAEKWFNDTNNAMMEIYNKQLNLTTGVYSNLLNSMVGNNKNWSGGQGFYDKTFNENLSKMMWMPFTFFSGNSYSNPFYEAFDKMNKQYAELSRNILSGFATQIKSNDVDLTSLNKEYKEILDQRMEASKKILNTMMESYNKQLNFSLETDKSTVEEINNQFSNIVKQNQKLWSDILRSYQNPFDGEDKKNKESKVNDDKKRSIISVVS